MTEQSSSLFGSIVRVALGDRASVEPAKVAQVERALGVMRAALTLASLATFGYGLLQHGLVGGLIALLGAASAFAVGAVLGFLFGLPRRTDPTVSGDMKQEDARGDKASIGREPYMIRPNTNLERIMDWLTALIVGLSLVHASDLLRKGTQMSIDFTAAIAGASTVQNASAGAAILLSFLLSGFIVVYLWAQRYMGPEMARADWESRRVRELEEKLTESKKKQNELVSEKAEQRIALDLMKAPDQFARSRAEAETDTLLAAVQAAVDVDQQPQPAAQRDLRGVVRQITAVDAEEYELSDLGALAKTLPLPADVVREIRSRYRKNTDWSDEPMLGFGPAQSQGYRLEADLDVIGKNSFIVNLRVSTESPPAERTRVVFLLHHTLPDCIRVATMDKGEAMIWVPCIGAFVVGAYVVGVGERLSLDLSKLPGAPLEFREG